MLKEASNGPIHSEDISYGVCMHKKSPDEVNLQLYKRRQALCQHMAVCGYVTRICLFVCELWYAWGAYRTVLMDYTTILDLKYCGKGSCMNWYTVSSVLPVQYCWSRQSLPWHTEEFTMFIRAFHILFNVWKDLLTSQKKWGDVTVLTNAKSEWKIEKLLWCIMICMTWITLLIDLLVRPSAGDWQWLPH